MNRKMIFYLLGQIIKAEAALMSLPLLVSIIYGEYRVLFSFAIAILLALAIGVALTIICRTDDKNIFAKEGFIIVSLAWISMSMIGALPFTLSGEIKSYVDAIFETVSGFTTTGATIFPDIENMSHGLTFWRSFTHWIGGMGVLVFVMAILPSSDKSIHIMRAEMPGPIVGKLVPKAKQTAKILYLIYIVLTIVQVIFLLFGEMTLFESIVHSFGTAGTGGFGIRSDSIESYSPYIQWVITVFMFIFGINFNLFYLILIGRAKSIFKSSELWCYILIILGSAGIICINIWSMFENGSDCIRSSIFQVVSIITTTGYATTDFNLWPELSKGILFTLMFVGGCAGSTAGGLKVSRIVLIFKMIKNELLHMLHPRSVSSVKFEGKKVDSITQNSVYSYFTLFMISYFTIFLIVSLDGFEFESTFTTIATCINNVGPAFGLFGPASNFSSYSDLSKIVLSFAMLLGRLEIYPLLFLITPSVWTKNK